MIELYTALVDFDLEDIAVSAGLGIRAVIGMCHIKFESSRSSQLSSLPYFVQHIPHGSCTLTSVPNEDQLS
jgi:hypothetical protein